MTINKEHLVSSILEAAKLFIGEKENLFPKEIDEDWFNGFLVEWNLNRNFNFGRIPENLEALINYLNTEYIPSLINPTLKNGDVNPDIVDKLANHCNTEEYTNRNAVPRSFASKISFFIRPDIFMPMDSYNTTALQNRERIQNNRTRNRILHDYKNFHAAFETQYKIEKDKIKDSIKASNIMDLINKAGVKNIDEETFARKVFDNILMIEGGRKNSFSNDFIKIIKDFKFEK